MATTPFELQSTERKPVELAMQSLWLTGRVLPTGAVLRVRHEFAVAGRKNVEAVYCFGLPRDAALRRFQLRTGTLEAHSELRPTEEAVKEYERGIAAGSLAALARQYGDGLVNLSVGNIRPGESVVVDLEVVAGVELRDGGLRLRFPFTLAPSYHGQASVSAPEPGWGEVELPMDEFGDVLLPRWAKDARGLHRAGFDLELEAGANVERVASPSHRIQAERRRVALAAQGDLPDRDLVLDVETGVGVRVLAGAAPNGTRHISAVIPSTEFGPVEGGRREAVLLIDRSGSMAGKPMEQAKSAALACLAALEPDDRFGLALFSSQPVVWRERLSPATKAMREDAARFLAQHEAEGGTELGSAIQAVEEILDGSKGEVLLLTDGQVFGGEELLRRVRKAGIRLHTLGIGSASQDRMLSLLARESGGVSRFVTPRERVDEAALEMFAGTGRAVGEGVEAAMEGTVTVAPAERVYAGTPATVMGRLSGEAEAVVGLRWRQPREGERKYAAEEGGPGVGEALRLLEGARRITDLDSRLTADGKSREERRVRNALRQLSEECGLASREMSLVAVMERKEDVGGDVPRTMIVPVGLPEDMKMGGVFEAAHLCAMPSAVYSLEPSLRRKTDSGPALLGKLRALFSADEAAPCSPPTDPVFLLATLLEDDGGMPGRNMAERIENSLDALEVFLAAGSGFSGHARRLARFLGGLKLEGKNAARLKEIESGRAVSQDPQETAAKLCRRMGA